MSRSVLTSLPAFRHAGLELACALASTLLLVFLVGPLLVVLLDSPYEAYVLGWRDAELLRAVGVSIGSAVAAVALGVLLGTPLAYLLARRDFPGRRAVQAILSLPLVIPHPVAGIALLMVFAKNSLVGAVLEGRLGIAVVDAAPGIVLAMLFVSSPLIIHTAQEGFRSTDARLERVAQSLGASPGAAFRHVALPLARPAIVAGGVSAFARAISEFGSIVVLAYFPRSAPVLIWDRFTAYGLREAIPATAFLLAVTLVIFWLATLAERRRRDLA